MFAYLLCINKKFSSIEGQEFFAELEQNTAVFTNISDLNYNGAFTVPNSINYSQKVYKIVKIGPSAFHHSKASKISLPSEITELSDKAFKNCVFEEMDLSNTSITTIPVDAFAYCTNLKTVKFPKCLKIIEIAAFSKSGITDLTFSQNITSIRQSAFYRTNFEFVNLSQTKITILSLDSFAHNYKLKEIEFPNTLTTLSEGSLKSTAITKITLPPLFEKFSGNPFGNYSDITIYFTNDTHYKWKGPILYHNSTGEIVMCKQSATTAELPSQTRAFLPGAFHSSSLKSLIVPRGLTAVKTHAFRHATGLKELIFNKALADIGVGAFAYSTLERIDLSKTEVTELPNCAFSSMPRINSILLPQALTKFGDSCFSGCVSLREFEVPPLVSVIPPCCFHGCGFERVDLTSTRVGVIGALAYADCTNLTYFSSSRALCAIMEGVFMGTAIAEVHLNGLTGATNLTNNTFVGCPKLETVYICRNSVKQGNRITYDLQAIRGIGGNNTMLFEELVRYRPFSSGDRRLHFQRGTSTKGRKRKTVVY